MKKNAKILLFSAIGILILGGALAALLLTMPEAKGDATTTTAVTVAVTNPGGSTVTDSDGNPVTTDEETASLTFSTYSAKDIVYVKITNPEDTEGYTILQSIKSTDDTLDWVVDGLESAPFNQSAFTSLLGYADNIVAMDLVETDAQDLSKYGLDKPQGSVEVKYSDGNIVSFTYGDKVVTGESGTYIRIKDTNKVYVYSTSQLKYFGYSRYSFLTTTLSDEYDSDTAPVVQNMTIERTDLEKPIIINALPEVAEDEDAMTYQTHEMTSPYNVLVDANNTNDTVYGMYGLAANYAVWYGKDETEKTKQYEKYGLDTPLGTVSMTVGAKTYSIVMGDAIVETSTDDNGLTTSTTVGYYGVYSEQPNTIYAFSSDVLIWATIKPENLMASLFLTPYIYAVDTLTIKTADKTYVFKIEGDADENKISLDGVEVPDYDEFRTLYQYLISSKGETVYGGSADGCKFIASVTYDYEDDALGTDVVEYYDSGDRKAIIKINGIETFKSTILYVNQLLSNIDAYLTGGTIVDTY